MAAIKIQYNNFIEMYVTHVNSVKTYFIMCSNQIFGKHFSSVEVLIKLIIYICVNNSDLYCFQRLKQLHFFIQIKFSNAILFN